MSDSFHFFRSCFWVLYVFTHCLFVFASVWLCTAFSVTDSYFAAAVFASTSWSCGAVSLASFVASAFFALATAFISLFSVQLPSSLQFFVFILFQVRCCGCSFLFDLFFDFLISFFERGCFFVNLFLSICARMFSIVILLCLLLFASREPFFFCALITNVAITQMWSLPMWVMSLASTSHVSSLDQHVINLFLCPSKRSVGSLLSDTCFCTSC